MQKILQDDIKRICEDKYFCRLEGKTLLVTGATGLIGSLVVKSCLWFNKNHRGKIKVIGIIRNEEKARNLFADFYEDPYFQIVQADLSVIGSINISDEVDYVIHTASVTTSRLFVEQPVETIELSYSGTKNILEFCRRKKCKGIVYLSSMEMYGKTNPDLPKVTENDLGYIDVLNVRSSYSEGKRMSECLCASYADEYNVPVRIARLAQTFGAGVMPEDNRVYAQFARSVIKGEDIVLHTKGESYGNYCYTTDVIRAISLLLLKGESGQAYNICNEETTTTIAGMAEMVAREFGRSQVKVVFDIPQSSKIYGYAPDVKLRLCAEKIKQLGWTPEYNLREMYQRMIDYMNEM